MACGGSERDQIWGDQIGSGTSRGGVVRIGGGTSLGAYRHEFHKFSRMSRFEGLGCEVTLLSSPLDFYETLSAIPPPQLRGRVWGGHHQLHQLRVEFEGWPQIDAESG